MKVLERIEEWVHTTVKMAPLKALGPLVIEGHEEISSKQDIQNHSSICTMYNGAVGRALTSHQESWALFQPFCSIN